ncbi:MAG: polysaccharide biosynthesis tyrosine autokinase [Paramuribaculum sp.]|nr:polysaccharide biosynthesis tyrosine autokinase [Paramuribaculum sp.]
MSTEESTSNNSKLSQGFTVNIVDVLYTTLKHWPWIILSVLLCTGVTLFYLLRTPSVYTRSASIIIKDDNRRVSGTNEISAISDMGLIKSKTNIYDEINKFYSPNVITEVVKRLNLDMSYYKEGKFHKDLIYGTQLPVKMEIPNIMENASLSAVINVDKNGIYTISDLIYNGEAVAIPKKPVPTPLGDTLRTSAGFIVVDKTPYARENEAYTIYVNRIPLKSAVGKFKGELSISLKSEDGSTIIISATDQSTQRAEDLINTLISVYNEKWMENRNQIAVSTSNFINDRLSVIEEELGHVDQNISSYQSEHLIPNVQQAASMYMSENQATTAQIMELTNQLQMTRYMRNYLTEEAHKTDVLPAGTGIKGGTIEGQIAEYNALMLRRNQYAANSSETHPVVMDLDAQLGGMRAVIISTIDNQIVALDTQIRNLQSSKNRTTAQIAANPTQAKYLLSVERQQKVKETLYIYLLQKREENELSQAFTAYNTEVIASPSGSNAPTAPKRERTMMIAFVIGLIIPFGVTYLLEMSNTKVRGRKDLENLSVPLLGEIPNHKPQKKEKIIDGVQIVVKQGKRDIVNEAFRVLRTNIGFITTKEQKCTAMMITSFNPGSGKTFIAVNLGIRISLTGKKVLVIDGDMRRASTSAYIQNPEIGLSNYLVGEYDDVNKLIVAETIAPGLSILPVGTIPPNPTELLESYRFKEMVTNLREYYDYIIVDCPPIELMADAQIVEQVVDRTMFVIRAGLLDRSMLFELEKIANEKKFKNIGIVLNDTLVEKSRYGYKYGYSYGYGYGHYGKYGNYGRPAGEK